MRAIVKSEIGLVRQTNEDNYLCAPPNLYIVADGMGGHVAGEVASNMVVNAVKKFIQEQITTGRNADEDLLRAAVLEANALVLNTAGQHQEYAGMGTTISMLYVMENTICLWAHVGDSRIYLLRDGVLTQLTKDHSLVWSLVENGMITKEESLVHPQRNMLTRAIGVEREVVVDTGYINLAEQDLILLCTDGLTNMINDENLQRMISSQDSLEQKVNVLVDSAIKAGGADNITALLIENY